MKYSILLLFFFTLSFRSLGQKIIEITQTNCPDSVDNLGIQLDSSKYLFLLTQAQKILAQSNILNLKTDEYSFSIIAKSLPMQKDENMYTIREAAINDVLLYGNDTYWNVALGYMYNASNKINFNITITEDEKKNEINVDSFLQRLDENIVLYDNQLQVMDVKKILQDRMNEEWNTTWSLIYKNRIEFEKEQKLSFEQMYLPSVIYDLFAEYGLICIERWSYKKNMQVEKELVMCINKTSNRCTEFGLAPEDCHYPLMYIWKKYLE